MKFQRGMLCGSLLAIALTTAGCVTALKNEPAAANNSAGNYHNKTGVVKD